VLANKLEEGEACKVCGSTTHPDKAVIQPDVLDERELEEIKKLRDKHLIDVQKLETKIQYEKNIIVDARNELQESGNHIENIKKKQYEKNISVETRNELQESRNHIENIKKDKL